jgi:hypothetical protein
MLDEALDEGRGDEQKQGGVLRALAQEADTIAFCVGFVALTTGVALVNGAAALVLAGAVLIALPFLAGRRR